MLWIFCRSVLFLLACWCWITLSPGLSVLLLFINQILSSQQCPNATVPYSCEEWKTHHWFLSYPRYIFYCYLLLLDYLSHFLSLTCVQICWRLYGQRKVNVAALSQQCMRKLLSRQLTVKQRNLGFEVLEHFLQFQMRLLSPLLTLTLSSALKSLDIPDATYGIFYCHVPKILHWVWEEISSNGKHRRTLFCFMTVLSQPLHQSNETRLWFTSQSFQCDLSHSLALPYFR